MIVNEKLEPYKGIPKRILIAGLRDRGFRLPVAAEMAIALNCSREVIIDLRHALESVVHQRDQENAELRGVLDSARREMRAAGPSLEAGRHEYILRRIEELLGDTPVPPNPEAEFLKEVLPDLPPDLQARGEALLARHGG